MDIACPIHGHCVMVRLQEFKIIYFKLSSGCLVTGWMLLPILIDWMNGITGQTGGSVITFNPKNITTFLTLLARYLSLASFEVPGFIDSLNKNRMAFLHTYYLVSPFVIVTALIGLAQPFYLTAGFFLKNPSFNFSTR